MFDVQAIAMALSAYKDSFESVSYEHPGYIHIEADGAVWAIGDANGPLGADYYEDAESFVDGYPPDRSLDIAVAETATAEDAAAAIVAAMVAK